MREGAGLRTSWTANNELAGMSLVEKGSVDDRTNSYGLTEHGYREIEARWEWEDQYVGVEG